MGWRIQKVAFLSRWRNMSSGRRRLLIPYVAATFIHSLSRTHSLSPVSSSSSIERYSQRQSSVASITEFYESEEEHVRQIISVVQSAEDITEDQVFQALLRDHTCCKIRLSNRIVEKLLDHFSNDWKSALGFFRWVGSRSEYMYTSEAVDRMVDILGKMKEMEKMLRLVEDVGELGLNLVTLKTVAKIMRRLCAAGRLEDAINIFNSLGEGTFSDLKKDTESMNLLLDTLCKEGKVDLARSVFLELKTHIAPSAHTFNIFIHGWCKSKRADEAKWTIEEMKGHGFSPSVISYSTLLQIHCDQSNFRMVYELLDEMRTQGCPPNVVTYTTIMHSLAKSQEIQEALQIVEKMKLSGCKPDTLFYNSLINILGRAGRLQEACHVFEVEMPMNNVSPNLSTYNTMISIYCRNSQEHDALKILKELEELGSCGNPDLLTYNPLIKLCFKKGRLDTLGNLLKDMIEKYHLSLDLDTYTLLVHGLCRAGKCDWASLLFEEMISRGITPRYRTCCLLLEEVEQKNMENMAEIIREVMKKMKNSD